MERRARSLSRRNALKFLGAAGGGLGLLKWGGGGGLRAQGQLDAKALEPFTGPGRNPHWNSLGPYVTEAQKASLILCTHRPVQPGTPRHYLPAAFTWNEAI